MMRIPVVCGLLLFPLVTLLGCGESAEEVAKKQEIQRVNYQLDLIEAEMAKWPEIPTEDYIVELGGTGKDSRLEAETRERMKESPLYKLSLEPRPYIAKMVVSGGNASQRADYFEYALRTGLEHLYNCVLYETADEYRSELRRMRYALEDIAEDTDDIHARLVTLRDGMTLPNERVSMLLEKIDSLQKELPHLIGMSGGALSFQHLFMKEIEEDWHVGQRIVANRLAELPETHEKHLANYP